MKQSKHAKTYSVGIIGYGVVGKKLFANDTITNYSNRIGLSMLALFHMKLRFENPINY